MFLAKVWNSIDPFTRLRQKEASAGMHSPDAFRAILERERARADRYGHGFSLLAFDVGNSDRECLRAKNVTDVIRQRKRSTDEAGWLGEQSIGIILPGTAEGGARKFAYDIFHKIGIDDGAPHYRIYLYPSERNSLNQGACSPESKDETGKGCDASEGRTVEFTQRERGEKIERCGDIFGHGMPFWKRGIDIFGSLILLLCLFPIFIMIATLIRIVSPGPALFKQRRIGYQGKPFTMWKFRTMRIDADASMHRERVSTVIDSENPMTKLDADDDPRIIPGGKLLRQTGLDELPQLFNVLRGEMSLVGPRPDPVYAVTEYPQWYHARVNVLPGITGLWQVNGKNRTTFKEMVRMDIQYGRGRSIWLDLMIIVRTMPAILNQVRESFSNTTVRNTPAVKGAKGTRQVN